MPVWLKSSEEFSLCESGGLLLLYLWTVTPIDRRRNVTDEIRGAYFDYFKIHLNQDNHWTPKYICVTCHSALFKWTRNQGKFSFGIPMIWREAFDHKKDCYFCAVPLKGINWERRHDPKYYATASTSTKPEPHSDSLRVPIHPSAQQTNTPSAQSTSTQQASSENVYTPLNESDKIHLFSQDDLDDLVRDLYLSKQLSELLASRLKDRNMLQKGKFRHSQ